MDCLCVFASSQKYLNFHDINSGIVYKLETLCRSATDNSDDLQILREFSI